MSDDTERLTDLARRLDNETGLYEDEWSRADAEAIRTVLSQLQAERELADELATWLRSYLDIAWDSPGGRAAYAKHASLRKVK